MRRLVEFGEWLLSGQWSPFQLVLRTLLAAYYVPIVLAVVLLVLGLIPYYFWTLFIHPSWLHLYFGLMFVGAVMSVLWNSDDSPPPVRRGRQVGTRLGTSPREGPTARPSRLPSKIRRGR